MSLEDIMLSMLEEDTDGTEIQIVRAPFGYPGGKAGIAKHIIPHLPYRSTYCECFGGSGVILLSRRASPNEIYNDRYGGVVSFYRCVKDGAKLQMLCDKISTALQSREEFIWCRDTWQTCADDVERGFRWFYMHQLSFGNLERHYGRQTHGRNQMAAKIASVIPEFTQIHNRLRLVNIENLDYRQCLRDYDSKDTVFYLDPPYYGVGRVYKEHMQDSEHEEMLELIFEAKGFVAISGYDNLLYGSYPWDKVIRIPHITTVRGSAFLDNNNKADVEVKTHKPTEEMLWVKV